jgi:FimV-like protein
VQSEIADRHPPEGAGANSKRPQEHRIVDDVGTRIRRRPSQGRGGRRDGVRQIRYRQAGVVGRGHVDTTRPAAFVHDMDFTLDASEKPAPLRSAPKPEPAMAGAGPSTAAPSLARPQAAIDLDKLDLSFDPERSTFEDPTPSVLDGQWHDAATKLDLAKAYQEMGDVAGAREILQEVLHEGDDQQKSEAQSLLSKLG